MAVVVEPQRFAGAFFIWYNTSRKVPVTLRGLVRFFYFFVIMLLVLMNKYRFRAVFIYLCYNISPS